MGHAKPENYYKTHPEAAFRLLEQCREGSEPSDISCAQIATITEIFRQWANEIQSDPQDFGQHIMQLQIHCATASLSTIEKQQCEEALEMRLGMVKWLESPES